MLVEAPRPTHYQIDQITKQVNSNPNLAASMNAHTDQDDDDRPGNHRNSSASCSNHNYKDGSGGARMSAENSPMTMSPWNQRYMMGPGAWSRMDDSVPQTGLIGSLVREEGHIYSLATSGDLLYTGSDSKNIRVWKNLQEFSGFKSHSGLVKAIVISGNRVFTGHQDGKVRVWKVSPRNPGVHKRAGTLPTLRAIIKCSIRPSNYVEGRRHRSGLWIKHRDAISCMSLNEQLGLLYTASWDRTFKVWRTADSKCLESVDAHDDAVNSIVAIAEGLLFTGSADGSVKVWQREVRGKVTAHCFVQPLLKQECAITALAVNAQGSIVYCGSSDGLVNFWEREKLLSHGGILKGHKLAVLCLAAAGCLVFTGSADKTICVWRREATLHTCLSVLTGHTGPVKCLAAEKDTAEEGGDPQRWIVYSGSLDKSVKVWGVSELATDLQRMAVMQTQMQQKPLLGGEQPWETFQSDGSTSSNNK